MLNDVQQKLESVWIQRDPTNSFFEEINISGSDLIIYHSSSGELQADRISVWAQKYRLTDTYKVKVSENDLTASYLTGSISSSKILPGNYISFSISNFTGSESLIIHSTGTSSIALTASYTLNALSASYANTASYSRIIDIEQLYTTQSMWSTQSLSAISASWASASYSASYALSSSYAETASYISSSQSIVGIATRAYNADTASWAPPIIIDLSTYLSSSWTGSNNSQFSGTSSYATITFYAFSASYAQSGSHSSRATTSSFAFNALSASYIRSGSGYYNGFGYITGSLLGTSSQAISASYAPETPIDLSTYLSSSWTGSKTSVFSGTASLASSASYWNSSSIANLLNTKQNNIATGSTLPITSSWSNNSISASYAPDNGASNLATGSTYPITSSWANNSISSSYAPIEPEASASLVSQLATKQPNLIQGSTYPITASHSITASYWNSSSIATILNNKQNNIATGSTLPITASVAITASYSETTNISSFTYNALSASYASHSLTADKIFINTSSVDYNFPLLFASGALDYIPIYKDSLDDITYNPSTNILTINGDVVANNFIGTASLAQTASYWNSSSIVTLIGTKQNNISTGSSLPITSSQSITASFAFSASYWDSSSIATILNTKQNNIATGSTLPVTSSWAENSLTASYFNQQLLSTGSTYPITSSQSITSSFTFSASYWNSSSIAAILNNKQNNIATGSTIPITSSWASNANTASYLGNGTVNYYPRWSGTNNLTLTSSIYQYNNNIGINTLTPSYSLDINNTLGATLGLKTQNSSNSPSIYLRRSFGTDTSASAITSDDSYLGTILLQGHTGTSFYNGITMYAKTSGSWNGGRQGINFIISVMDSEFINIRKRYLQSNQMGIGTIDPQKTLHVQGEITCSNITASALYGTASWANNSISSSYWDSSSIAIILNTKQNNIATGSLLPVTSSWALNANTASYIGNGTNNYVPVWINNVLSSTSSIVNSLGNVGIGTTSPNARLDVKGTLRIGHQGIGAVAGYQFEEAEDDTYMKLSYYSTETTEYSIPLTVTYTGKVGIGITNPSAKFHISSSNASDALIIDQLPNANSIKFLTAGTFNWLMYLSGSDLRFFDSNNADRVTFKGGGNVGIGTINPERLLTLSSLTYPQFKVHYNDTYYMNVSQNDIDVFGQRMRLNASSSQNVTLCETAVGGNVGIGTSNAYNKFVVEGYVSSTASLHPHATCIASFGQYGGVDLAMSQMPSAPYGWWLQARHNVADGLSYPLLLNPAGGNVGIGTDNPQNKLDIFGSPAFFRIQNQLAGGYGNGIILSGIGYGAEKGSSIWNYDYPEHVNSLGKHSLNIVLGASGSCIHFGKYSDNGIGTGGTLYTSLLFISGSGNVGIGTTTPTDPLTINGDLRHLWANQVTSSMLYDNDYEMGLAYEANARTIHIFNKTQDSGGNIVFEWPGSIKGNVGIGTTNPGLKLTVQGDTIIARPNAESDANLYIGPRTEDTLYAVKLTYNSTTGNFDITPRTNYHTIFTAGNVGIGTTNPISTLSNTASRVGGVGSVLGINWSIDNGTYYCAAFENRNTSAWGANGLYVKINRSDANANIFSLDNVSGAGTGNVLNVLANGNVGIGTTNPTTKLSVVGDNGATTIHKLTNGIGNLYYDIYDYAGNEAGYFGYGSGTWDCLLSNLKVGKMLFYVTDGIKMAISGSNVGIGTTNPLAKLQVNDAFAQSHIVLSSDYTGVDNSNWAIRQSAYAYGDFGIVQSTALNGDPIAAGTVRLLIKQSNGYIGIGTTSPNAPLEIYGTNVLSRITTNGGTYCGWSLYSGATEKARYAWNTVNGAYIVPDSNGFTIFSSSTSDPILRVLDNGNVGIGGITTPSYKLHVAGEIVASSYILSANGLYGEFLGMYNETVISNSYNPTSSVYQGDTYGIILHNDVYNGITAEGFPTNYGNLITIKGRPGHSVNQLLLESNFDSSNNCRIYTRASFWPWSEFGSWKQLQFTDGTNATGTWSITASRAISSSYASTSSYANHSRRSINILTYGAVGDGTTDSTTAIQNALNVANTSGLPIYIPSGSFVVSNLTTGVNVKYIYGDGRQSKLIFKAGSTGYLLDVSTGQTTMDNLYLYGGVDTTYNDAGFSATGTRHGIYHNCTGYSYIHNVWVSGFSGIGLSITGDTDMYTRIDYAQLQNVNIYNCQTGIKYNDSACEYLRTVSCMVYNCYYGIWCQASNQEMTNLRITDNYVGAYFIASAGGRSHCNLNTSALNHNYVALSLNNIATGFLFNGNRLMGSGIISLNSCDGTLITNNLLQGLTLNIDAGCGFTKFSDNISYGAITVVDAGTTSIRENNYNFDSATPLVDTGYREDYASTYLWFSSNNGTHASGKLHHVLKTGDVPRMAIGLINAEAGTNTGSDLFIASYDDAGALITYPISVNRANSLVQFATTPKVNSDFILTNNGMTNNYVQKYTSSLTKLVNSSIISDANGVGIGGAGVAGYALAVVGNTQIGGHVECNQLSASLLKTNNGVANHQLYQTSGVNRFIFSLVNAETGANAGGDFAISRYSDAGAFISYPLSINRSNGLIQFETTPKVNADYVVVNGGMNNTYVPHYNGTTLVDGQIIDNGTGVGIGGSPVATWMLSVYGNFNLGGHAACNQVTGSTIKGTTGFMSVDGTMGVTEDVPVEYSGGFYTLHFKNGLYVGKT